MDQRAREISAAPENELQKQGGVDDVPVTEYEHRFRKSVEKMQVPDWYRDYSTRQLGHQPQSSTVTTTQTRYDLPPASQAWSYTNPPLTTTQPPPPLSSSQSHQHYQQHHSQQSQQQQRHSTSPPVGG
uniref:Uncharacterized protein n=1 Tax=Panagrolaimus sp. ES5 TaxID=591445 RepID=A0AC34FXH7_9BILA